MNKILLLKNQFLKILPYMPELLGFETMLTRDPYGMAVDARVVAGLVFSLLFKLVSSYCARGSPGLKENPQRMRRSPKCKPRGFEGGNPLGNLGIRGLRRTPWYP